MKNIIILEYIINLAILLVFYMHMFQLNSYFFKKYILWIKTNIKKIALQILLVLFPSILLIFKSNINNILAITFLGFSIFYNFPKNTAKIKFKLTNRVKRMFITEILLLGIIVFINIYNNFIILKLCIFNILSPIICIIANFINFPLEYSRRQTYIYKAKKILKNMPDLIVIGITGSYGKTSVKNFLEKTLSSKYEVLVTPKNYNTTMGVIKTIREQLKPTHQIFICEMGATNIGDIKEICDIVKPKIGIITAIGPQHLESFKNIDNIVKTKFELATSVKNNDGVIFLNYNNEYLANQKLDMQMFSYGINNNNLDFNSYDIVSSSKGLSFKILDKSSNKEVEFKTKIIGKHNVINLTAAISVANYLGISFKDCISSIRNIKSVEHRLQLINRGNMTIIDDSYNSNPISSKSALDTLSEFDGSKIIITPGLIELGKNEKQYNFEFGQYMAKICDYIFLVGNTQSKSILNGINSNEFSQNKIFTVNSPQEAIKQISNLKIHGNITVLLENDLPDNYNL